MSKTSLWGVITFVVVLVIGGIVFFFWQKQPEPPVVSPVVRTRGAMKISSSAFADSTSIPRKYTCDGQEVNPPLAIENVPTATKSLAFIVDDPDAPSGMFVHWVVWNIDPTVSLIAENSVPRGAVQGLNDARGESYRGPCPPSGTHRYFFKLYALDTVLNLPPSARKQDVEKAMGGHILEQAQIIGLYQRQ